MLDNSRRAFSGFLPFLPIVGGFDNEMRAAMVAVLVAMGVATVLSLYVSWKQSKELAKLERAAEDVATILRQERHHHDYFEAQDVAREAASESSESTSASMPALVPASDTNDINNDINNDIINNINNNNDNIDNDNIDDDDDGIHILSTPPPKKSAKSAKKSAKSAIAAKQ